MDTSQLAATIVALLSPYAVVAVAGAIAVV